MSMRERFPHSQIWPEVYYGKVRRCPCTAHHQKTLAGTEEKTVHCNSVVACRPLQMARHCMHREQDTEAEGER